MNSHSRSTSFAASIRPPAARRPSVSSRLSFAVNTAELGESTAENGQGIAVQHQIEEEIAKIKRYEVGPLPPPGQIKCWSVLTMCNPGLHHDWYDDRFSRSRKRRRQLVMTY